MTGLIKRGKDQINLNRYSDLIHQILDGINEDDQRYDQLALEICHASKFICELDPSIEIVKKTEKPDFILKSKEKIIGLEHEILVDEETRKKEGSLKDLVKALEKEYRRLNPDKKLLLVVYPMPYLTFRKSDKPRIMATMMQLIGNFIQSGLLPENDYIESLTKMPHSRLDFHCNLGAWWQKNMDSESLNKAIIKKEEKLKEYRDNSGTNEQWLLIVIGSLGESSYEVESLVTIDNSKQTGFNKIYLLEDFRSNLYEIK
jgi:hypothetical protein